MRQFMAFLCCLALVIVSIGSVSTVQAQGDQIADLFADYPEAEFVASDFAFEGPDQIESGFTVVTMVNEGIEPHHLQLMRLHDDVTMEDVDSAFQQGQEAVFGLGEFVGGPTEAEAGGTNRVILDLRSGNYLALCFVTGEDGVPHIAKGMVATLEVVEGANDAVAPEAAVTVLMSDFVFDMPLQIEAGAQVWEVINEGPQPHEIVIYRLTEDVSSDDVIARLGGPAASPEAGHDMAEMDASPDATQALPLEPVGGVQGLSTGLSGWAVLDLEPGEYLAVCFIPDPQTGQSHLALGMVEAFTVE